MQMSRLNDWLQLLTSVGVLVGLLLVVLEIRQNNELARAETSAGTFAMWESLSQSEFQSDINDLFVKSIEHPSELTTSEIMDLNSWLVNVVSIYQRNARMHAMGLAGDPEVGLRGAANYYFTGPFARAWLEENKDWIIDTTPIVYEAIRDEIDAQPVQTRFDYVDHLKSRLKDQ